MTSAAVIAALQSLPQRADRFGIDVEGRPATGVTCFSFAWFAPADEPSALWVPLRRLNGSPWWSPADEVVILNATRAVLENPSVGKIGHAVSYEAFMWRYAHGIQLAGIVGDSMFAWSEIQPEMERAINVGASILTRQPFWGDSNDPATDLEMAQYNVTDSAVSLELEAACVARMTPGQREHYAFNISLLPALADHEWRGLAVDVAARDRLVASLEAEVRDLQAELDTLAGIAPPSFKEVAQVVALNRKLDQCVDWPDLVRWCKPSLAKP